MAGELCGRGCGYCGMCDAEPEHFCDYCGSFNCDGDCPEYYEALEGEMEEWNPEDSEAA